MGELKCWLEGPTGGAAWLVVRVGAPGAPNSDPFESTHLGPSTPPAAWGLPEAHRGIYASPDVLPSLLPEFPRAAPSPIRHVPYSPSSRPSPRTPTAAGTAPVSPVARPRHHVWFLQRGRSLRAGPWLEATVEAVATVARHLPGTDRLTLYTCGTRSVRVADSAVGWLDATQRAVLSVPALDVGNGVDEELPYRLMAEHTAGLFQIEFLLLTDVAPRGLEASLQRAVRLTGRGCRLSTLGVALDAGSVAVLARLTHAGGGQMRTASRLDQVKPALAEIALGAAEAEALLVNGEAPRAVSPGEGAPASQALRITLPPDIRLEAAALVRPETILLTPDAVRGAVTLRVPAGRVELVALLDGVTQTGARSVLVEAMASARVAPAAGMDETGASILAEGRPILEHLREVARSAPTGLAPTASGFKPAATRSRIPWVALPAGPASGVPADESARTTEIGRGLGRDDIERRLQELEARRMEAGGAAEGVALIVESSGLGPPARRYFLEPQAVVIGRGDHFLGIFPDIDLLPFDPDHTVSREHARIEPQAQGFTLTDLGSTNGTYLNEGAERLPSHVPHSLQAGRRFLLGKVVMRLEWG